jgi:tetratricopeptide (TPR) repeat protein
LERRQWRRLAAVCFAVLVVCWTGWSGWNRFEDSRAQAAAAAGRQYLEERRDELAERELAVALERFPDDAELRLLWAQAVIGGRSRSVEKAAELAISGLARIPDTSPDAAEARMREGRLALLVLQQPDRAERLLRQSLQLNPAPIDAHYLLWKLYELTDRYQEAEPFFRAVWERTAVAERGERLRDWYLSQFSPLAATADLDRRMGFIAEGQVGSAGVVVVRLATFQRNEPASAITLAVNAAHLIQLRDRESALPLLESVQSSDDARASDFFLSVWLNLLLELGRLPESQAWFEAYKGPRQGHLYDRMAGRMEQTVYRRDERALEHFDRALAVWPGAMDWSLLHFRAQSLARLGRRQEADQTRARAKEIELLMELPVHQQLRQMLLNLNDPATLREMEKFYRALGRSWEADEWSRLAADLPSGQ